jgi:hypothetical protein
LRGFAIVATALLFCPAAAAQISPGPLSRSHMQLEGVTKCAACHDFGAGIRGFKCLDCHTEIRRRVETNSGFHARAYKSAAGQTDCARCHMEHNGRGFALARLDRKTFDHAAQTGLALTGKHSQQACERCHNENKIAAAARPEIKVKDLNHTFLGLRRECAGCHEDRHRGDLGTECTRCHTQDAWRPAPGFNHARSPFPLTGLHQAVACQKCHTPRPDETAVRFKGIAFSGCQNCHMDPHRGAFQDTKVRGTCESCHNTSGWKQNRPGSGFDHNATRFALLGKHAELACSKCHNGSNFRKPIAHERCADCHQDPHRGQFTTRTAGSDCASCHTESGFKPTRFDRVTHQRSAFPLEGKHAVLQCRECHQPEGREAVYITRKLVCSACHADRHGGEFAAAPDSNRCDLCHTTTGYQPTTFTVERHAGTGFALTGRHAAVACSECHKTRADLKSDGSTPPPRQYHFAVQTCNACHSDRHRTKVSCETCHTTEGWKTVRAFDHSNTTFKLEGAHQKVRCVQCHAPRGTAPDFAGASSRCASCHQGKDVHGGQFHSAGRDEDCSSCHITARWNSVTFNHDQARFALDVAHRNVACAKCHKESTDSTGKAFRVFRATPVECVQCH